MRKRTGVGSPDSALTQLSTLLGKWQPEAVETTGPGLPSQLPAGRPCCMTQRRRSWRAARAAATQGA